MLCKFDENTNISINYNVGPFTVLNRLATAPQLDFQLQHESNLT